MAREIDERELRRLYTAEKKSLRDIAKLFGCSHTLIRNRIMKYNIKLRPQAPRRISLEKSILQKLFLEERKLAKEVAEISFCSYCTIYNRCKEYGILKKMKQRFKRLTKGLLHKLYIREGMTTRDIAKMLDCSFETVRKKCIQYGIPLRKPGGNRRSTENNVHKYPK